MRLDSTAFDVPLSTMRTSTSLQSNAPRRRAAAVAALALLSGCGFGTAGVTAAASGGGGTAPADPVVTSLQAPRSPTSPATVAFVLVAGAGARVDASLQYRTAGSASFQPVTLAAGSPGLTGLTGNANAPYQVQWNFAADLGGQQYTDGIELRLAIQGGNAVAIADVAQGNDAPQLTDVQPAPLGAAEYSANTDVRFAFADSAQDPVDVRIEFNSDAAAGFPASGWQLARPAATPSSLVTPDPQVVNLVASVTTTNFEFRWDTVRDLVGFDDQVQLRVTLTDRFGASTTALSSPFQIDNNQPPIAVLQEASFVNHRRNRGVIPIPFQAIDAEGDPVRIAVQWTNDDQPFPNLPGTAAGLIDLLDNPGRAADRKLAQIATQYLPSVEGRVGALAGLGATEVRLPELASSGAQLLAEGLGGATLEVRRLNDSPSAVTWASSPLVAPVAALAGDDAYTTLVLDQGDSGWRLRVVDLETGAVVRSLASGSGTPRALALDPTGARVFVGTQVGIHRVDRATGAQLNFLAHDFVDGPRGLAAISGTTVIASGDSRLVRCNVEAGARADVLTGLAGPFGVARDPLDDQRVYFAENAANRVRRLDLDRRVPETVPASVAVANQPALGAIAFPLPRAIAFEANGSRLLVMTTHQSTPSLRALELGEATTIYQVTNNLATTGDSIGVGPDRLRMIPLAASNALAVGGGASARRILVSTPPAGSSGGQQQPYDPARQVVRLAAPFDGPIATGTVYRLVRSATYSSGATGTNGVFRWDSDADVFAGSRRVRVFLIDGDIGTASASPSPKALATTFPSSPTSLPLAHTPAALLATDLNGDGRMDFVTTDPANGRVYLLVQTNEGTYPASPTLLTTEWSTSPIGAADFNGDGRIDIATSTTGGLSVFLQSPAGAFPPTPLGSGSFCAAADITGDGRADLVAAVGGELRLFAQTAAGGLPATSTVLATGASNCAVADVDGDSRLDLVTASASQVSVFVQTSTGTFPATPVTVPAVAFFSGFGTLTGLPVITDTNNDGRPDIVIAYRSEILSGIPGVPSTFRNGVAINLQTSTGAFSNQSSANIERPSSVGASPDAVATADIDGDGRRDLVIQDATACRVFIQSHLGLFGPNDASTLTDTGGTTAPALADFDGDGRIDVALARPGRVDLWYAISPGAFAPTDVPIQDPTINGSPDIPSFAAADINGDGRLDFVSYKGTSFSGRQLAITAQDSLGTFVTTNTTMDVQVGDGLGPLTCSDLNGDGAVDIAMSVRRTLSNFPSYVAIFRNVDQGFSGIAQQLAMPGWISGVVMPMGLAAADITGSASFDLVAVSSDTRTVSLFENSFNNFTSATNFPLPPSTTSPFAVLATDLNGDGLTDVVAAGGSQLSLLVQSTGLPLFPFPPTASLTTGAGTSALVAADLNGDGRIDLVSADTNSNQISFFLQASTGTFPTMPMTRQTGLNPIAVVTADVNDDGLVDIVSADSGSNRLSLFVQTPAGIFPISPKTLATNASPKSLVAADVDGDGLVDLVTGSQIFYNR